MPELSLKEFIRRIIWYADYIFPIGDEFVAEVGTWKWRFLNWLYEGDGQPEFDVVWPSDAV